MMTHLASSFRRSLHAVGAKYLALNSQYILNTVLVTHIRVDVEVNFDAGEGLGVGVHF
jgi:hypothetical protein